MNRKITQNIFLILVVFNLIFSSCTSFLGLKNHGRQLYERIEQSSLPWSVWAHSVEDRNIRLLEIGESENVTVIFGAFHGSERLSGELAFRFSEYLYPQFLNQIECKVIFVPVVNPDGLVRGQRTNANGVDINRNFPTQNWTNQLKRKHNFPGDRPGSEPETIAVIDLLEKYQPDRIISIHTPLKVVNYDGPAQELAEAMAMLNGYPVAADIGYPTPGSFGTYAGVERNIPVITLELPRGNFEKIWQDNRDALMITLQY